MTYEFSIKLPVKIKQKQPKVKDRFIEALEFKLRSSNIGLYDYKGPKKKKKNTLQKKSQLQDCMIRCA